MRSKESAENEEKSRITPHPSPPTGQEPGTLYIVATPIGNLEDITLRALRILKEVDLVAAEDTRHSRKLFNHYGITTPLTSCFEHNEVARAEQFIARMHQGKSVALIADAGTPAISDPGYRLVRRCREEGLVVRSIPGPSAVVAALSVSGLPTDRFTFEGFLPVKTKPRREAFQNLLDESRTVVFYETPHRLPAALRDLAEVLDGERQIAVARELTKMHEELFRGTATEACDHFGKGRVRGEIVLLIAPAPAREPAGTVKDALRRWQAETDLPPKEIVKRVAREFGLSGSEVYRQSLELAEEVEGEED